MTDFNQLALRLFLAFVAVSDPAQGVAPSTTWTDAYGQPNDLNRWKDRYLIVAVFYTSCASTCPMGAQNMKILERELAASHVPFPYDFVLFSIDPKVDTPAQLAAYAKARGLEATDWHLLTGDLEKTRRLVATFGLGFSANGTPDHVMHSNKFVVLAPGLAPIGVYDSINADKKLIVKDMMRHWRHL